MLPYITILGKEIPMYGLMAALGCLFAVLYLKIAQRRHPELEADSELALVYGIIGVFVGAKLFYLIIIFPQLLEDLPYLFSEPALFFQNYLYSGFVFYGGLAGAVAAVVLYCRIAKVRLKGILQLLTPMLPLIHGFGRIGCLMAGCCYGREAAIHRFGIVFPASSAAPAGIPLVPVQLYEAIAELLIFVLLVILFRKNWRGDAMLYLYLVCYGLVRFVLEFYRGDTYRGFIGPLSISQVIALGCILIGIPLLTAIIRKKQCGA